MKNKTLIIGIVCLFILVTLTGCGSKTVITTNEFKTKAESLNYEVTDITNQYENDENIKEVMIAQSPEGYQVEFYVYRDEPSATREFNNTKELFEMSKGNVSSEASSAMGNYSSYSLTSAGYYMHVCRVENTLIHVYVDATYKDSAKTLVNELGY